MINLWIDIDDSLVLYQNHDNKKHPFGIYMGDPWEPNTRLINGIKNFAQNNPNSLIVIWSGGGKDYAQMWKDKLLPDIEATAMSKNPLAFELVKSDDIVVDDAADDIRGITAKILKPNEWP